MVVARVAVAPLLALALAAAGITIARDRSASGVTSARDHSASGVTIGPAPGVITIAPGVTPPVIVIDGNPQPVGRVISLPSSRYMIQLELVSQAKQELRATADELRATADDRRTREALDHLDRAMADAKAIVQQGREDP